MPSHPTLRSAATLALLVPAALAAQITPITNPSHFSAGATLITFEGEGIVLPWVTVLDGVTFSEGPEYRVMVGSDGDERPFGPQEPKVVNAMNDTNARPLGFAFSSPVNRVAFELRHNFCRSSATVRFYSGATQVATAQTPTTGMQPLGNCSPAEWVFAGFQSDVPFDRVTVSGPSGSFVRADNIRFENFAPEPVRVIPLADPSSFSPSATLLTFQGAANRTSSLGGVTFSRGVADVRCGMFSEPRPFGPQEPMGCDNDQPFDGTPITMVLPGPATRIAFEAAYNGCGERVGVEFLMGTDPVGSAQGPASPGRASGNCSPGDWVFVAFEVTAPFDRIRVSGPVGGYVRFDNLRWEGGM